MIFAMGVAVIILLVLVTALAVSLWRAVSSTAGDPAPAIAHSEVETWYRSHGRAGTIARCDFVVGDSESDRYICIFRRPCHGRLMFDVPRAGTPQRYDAAPLPESSIATALAACPRL